MLIKGFQKPTKYSESYMSTSEILNYLRSFTTLNLSEKKMGEAIRKAGFERISKRIGNNPMYVYRIEKISPCPFIASV
jgi:hypothetical protein